MAREWDPELELDESTTAALIARRFPAFAGLPLTSLGSGWDSSAWRVGTHVFRVPRHSAGDASLGREATWMPLIGPRLTLPTSQVSLVAGSDDHFPWRIVGHREVGGTTLGRARPSEAARAALAAPLGRFLQRLHQLPLELPHPPPLDTLQRSDRSRRAPRLHERVDEAAAWLPPGVTAAALHRVVDQACGVASHDGPLSWCHGDLYARHLVLHPDHTLAGVIDWGDMHLGDPAIDLAVAVMVLPPGAWRAFRDAYGGVDDAAWQRARFRAVHYGVILLPYGVDRDDDALIREGQRALRNALR